MDETTWRRRTELPLMIAGFAYLIAYSWWAIGDLSGTAAVLPATVVLLTWAFFIVDYLVRLGLAERKWTWFRTHLATLAFALVPVLRLVRLLRVLTPLPGVRSTPGNRLRTEITVYGAGVAVILIYVASLAVLQAERHSPDANITTFGIAVWWACVTVTTTGYGDYTPVTDAGRLIGVGLMFGGIVLAGIITAALASVIVENASRDRDDHEPATRAQVRALTERIDALTAIIERQAGSGTDKPTDEHPTDGE